LEVLLEGSPKSGDSGYERRDINQRDIPLLAAAPFMSFTTRLAEDVYTGAFYVKLPLKLELQRTISRATTACC
jgi:hypothetical protein